INVSSRIGAGGVTSTVPDLLLWARAVIAGKVVSPKWHAEIFTPVTTKAGRWSGLGDADEYYTLGWMVRPVNGNFMISHHGSQKGTEARFYVFPAKRMAITILSNLEFAPLDKYVERLYEILTGEEWATRVFTRNHSDAPLARSLDSTFNYGSLHFWQHQRQMVTDASELAQAFNYFNTNAGREALRADRSGAAKRIRDGRHPVGNNAFIKLGSFMASKLVEKNGRQSFARYHTGGAIPFFADYVRLYKSDPQVPQELRFTPTFETMIERWDADWARTWNQHTRNLTLTSGSDFQSIGTRLRKEFDQAEVYPDFSPNCSAFSRLKPRLVPANSESTSIRIPTNYCSTWAIS
ncbi:MAG: serine hydrolase domain-containing protein, partial [Pyrinomonadaceae bacterium]